MKKNKQKFEKLIKPGRPIIGRVVKSSQPLSLDGDIIAWLKSSGNASGMANRLLRAAKDKHDIDSEG